MTSSASTEASLIAAIAIRYLFTISVSDIESLKAGETPKGARVHTRYVGGNIDVRAAMGPISDDWRHQKGELVSGTDWVTVRRDGVAEFDARLTIRASDCLLGATVMGSVDLSPAYPRAKGGRRRSRRESGVEAFQAWKRDSGERRLTCDLFARFDPVQVPPSWAAEDFKRGLIPEHFEDLYRGYVLVRAELELRAGLVTAATLHFFRLDAPLQASDREQTTADESGSAASPCMEYTAVDPETEWLEHTTNEVGSEPR